MHRLLSVGRVHALPSITARGATSRRRLPTERLDLNMPSSPLGLDDVIVQMKRRRTIGACYVLRTAHGPDQLFFRSRSRAVAHALAFARHTHRRVWCDDGDHHFVSVGSEQSHESRNLRSGRPANAQRPMAPDACEHPTPVRIGRFASKVTVRAPPWGPSSSDAEQTPGCTLVS
jgi:hypothetical protein